MATPYIIATHSYRGGTGKSNVTANIAAELALSGLRVGVVDTDLPSPGIHILFGQDEPAVTINGVIDQEYGIAKACIDVTPTGPSFLGKIFLLAGSPKPGRAPGGPDSRLLRTLSSSAHTGGRAGPRRPCRRTGRRGPR